MSRVYAGESIYTATMGAMLAQNMAMPLHATTTVVASGTTEYNLLAMTGDTIEVYGKTNDTIAGGGGTEKIYSGGEANSTGLNTSGTQYVYGGGTANDTVVNGGGVQYVQESGAVTNLTTISDGGMQTVMSGAVANGTVVSVGGSQIVYDSAIVRNTTVNGHQYVYSGGQVSSTTLNSGAVFNLYSGAQASGVTQNAGAKMSIQVIGDDSTTFISGTNGLGSTFYMMSGYASNFVVNGWQSVSAGGSDVYAVIKESGVQNISSGGVASNTTVNSGGAQVISAGGRASSSTINAGGVQQVQSGGFAYDALVNTSGLQNVQNGGYVGGALINGGTQNVSSGAAAVGTTFNNGTMNIYQGATVNGLTATGGAIYVNGNNTLQGNINLAHANVHIRHTSGLNTLTMSRLSANNATFNMNVDLSNQTADKLNITSSYTGNANLKLTEVASGAVGAVVAADPTEGDGIKLVEFGSSAAVSGTFALDGGQWDKGGYVYKLEQGTTAGVGKDYYLRATSEYTDTFKTILNIPVMNTMIAQTGMNSLQRRMGDLRGMNNEQAKHGVWARTYVKGMTVKDLAKTNMSLFGAEAGYDCLFRADEPTKLYAGVLVGFVSANSIKTENNKGMYDKGDGEAPGVGVYATLVNEDGWFVDIAARNFWSKLDMKNHASDGTELSYKPSRNVLAASVEVGKSFKSELARDKFLHIEPKLELGYMNAAGADADVSGTGNKIKYDATNYINAKAGVLFAYNARRDNGLLIEPLLELAYRHEFDGKGNVSYGGATEKSNLSGGTAEINAGLNMQLTDNLYWYGLGSYEASNKVSGWRVHAGIRYAFGDNMPKQKSVRKAKKSKSQTVKKTAKPVVRTTSRAVRYSDAQPTTRTQKATGRRTGGNARDYALLEQVEHQWKNGK